MANDHMYNDPDNKNGTRTDGIKRRWVGSTAFDLDKLPEAVKQRLREEARDTAPREDKTKKGK